MLLINDQLEQPDSWMHSAEDVPYDQGDRMTTQLKRLDHDDIDGECPAQHDA
jgi:hypothetical protein